MPHADGDDEEELPDQTPKRKPFGDDDYDDLGDPFGGDDENQPDSVRSTATKQGFWTDAIGTPSIPGLPVYAEQIARRQSENPTPSSVVRNAMMRKDIQGKSLLFVDDEAREATSDTPRPMSSGRAVSSGRQWSSIRR
ncbi:hypothetical protein R1sor_001245 [Riccia sorocarpa]|uniref:Uncharacterized protein n=1 Tax=Riccia sorocarpa TaxID=122646 RepID=A0ABD3GVG1_9MARC